MKRRSECHDFPVAVPADVTTGATRACSRSRVVRAHFPVRFNRVNKQILALFITVSRRKRASKTTRSGLNAERNERLTFGIDRCLVPLLEVKIEKEGRAVSANKPQTVTCRAVGSSPAPRITWWKSGVRLQASHESVSAAFPLVDSDPLFNLPMPSAIY